MPSRTHHSQGVRFLHRLNRISGISKINLVSILSGLRCTEADEFILDRFKNDTGLVLDFLEIKDTPLSVEFLDWMVRVYNPASIFSGRIRIILLANRELVKQYLDFHCKKGIVRASYLLLRVVPDIAPAYSKFILSDWNNRNAEIRAFALSLVRYLPNAQQEIDKILNKAKTATDSLYYSERINAEL